LWDFPRASLARREVAAYLVSEALGWRLVPATVYRRRAPLGPGSVQLFVDHEPAYHYFSFSAEDLQRLRPTALFDLLINNADRKGSHVIVALDGHLWCIDHGVCFHIDDKLRTVIWDFAGELIPPGLRADLADFLDKLAPAGGAPSPLNQSLREYISQGEIKALVTRAEALVKGECYPNPNPHRRHYPWPQL
jgi:uncharacterized repeat protein (TIGR03843 family)